MTTKKKILVTGGTGYIGSHVAAQLLARNFDVIIVDNLTNSTKAVCTGIEKITQQKPNFIKADILDRKKMQEIMTDHEVYAVMHFAGLKSVSESEADPAKYYENNVQGSIALIQAMKNANVKKIIFSSSATVYGKSESVKYNEALKPNPINVYGRTKLITENILRDIACADSEWKVAILRYFNPVGAHESAHIGEAPTEKPNNLMPIVSQVAAGKRDKVTIYGNDYPTEDGTCKRDFIHIQDLASGHIAALDKLKKINKEMIINLGTGRPHSVLELIKEFSRISGRRINYEFGERRKGDLSEYYADPSLAEVDLGWKARLDLNKMCEDAWRWQLKHEHK
jgi:UDP-glucose 4-epimerase